MVAGMVQVPDHVCGPHIVPCRTVIAGPAANSVTDAVWELPFQVAVIVAVWLLVTFAAVAEKLAEVAPPATSTDDGTVRLEFWVFSATAAPPLGAAVLIITVQVVLPGVVTEDGLQLKELTVAAILLGAALKATVVAAKVSAV